MTVKQSYYRQFINWFKADPKRAIKTIAAYTGGASAAILLNTQLAEEMFDWFDAPATVSIICVYLTIICGAITSVSYLNPNK